MAVTGPNANFATDILSTTLNNHLPKIIDNVFTARPLFHFLNQAGQIKMVDGGVKIVVPLIMALNGTAGSFSGYDTFSLTPITSDTNSTGLTAAEYGWKSFAVSIGISGEEEDVNSGDTAVVDLLEAKTMQAEESISEALDLMFIQGDGTGNSGKDWLGLKNLVRQNASAVGGIDPATNTKWRSTIDTAAEALGIAKMATVYNTVSVGNDQPNMGLTTQALYERYESLLQPQLRFADAGTADAGFQNLMFKGAPVVYDANVTAGDLFWLNTKYLRLIGHKNTWFRTTPFVRPSNQEAKFAQILLRGNFTVVNRARQGVMTAKTA
jgi:hypothetical protein